MVPDIPKDDSNLNDLWSQFLDEVLTDFNDDPVVKPGELEIIFEVGEHPALPRAGYAFRRFSSKISGSVCKGTYPYVSRVYDIARKHFGSRVNWWSNWDTMGGMRYMRFERCIAMVVSRSQTSYDDVACPLPFRVQTTSA